MIIIALISHMAIGQTKRQSRLTRKQQIREGENHGCILTNKYSQAELRKFYPFNIANSVSLVSFESDIEFTNELPIVNGEIDYSKIKETKILDRIQTDSLASIFYNVAYRGKILYLSAPTCYNPRNAVLFFDSKNHLLEFIELCFECYRQKDTAGTPVQQSKLVTREHNDQWYVDYIPEDDTELSLTLSILDNTLHEIAFTDVPI